ncbi:hypothetical protein NXC24_PB00084 (plasmid) [Rhizobium sp. NXC24]|nr:hypothetical protein NXC24_PB00084 [Rhizobium sp. NXC24]
MRFIAQPRKLTGRSLGNNRFFEAVCSGGARLARAYLVKNLCHPHHRSDGDSPVLRSSAGAIFTRERLDWPHHARSETRTIREKALRLLVAAVARLHDIAS